MSAAIAPADTPSKSTPVRERYNPLEYFGAEMMHQVGCQAARNVVKAYQGTIDALAESLQNAVDAAKHKYSETDETSHISVKVDLRQSTIEISDTATGMSLEEVKRYLGPDSTSKRARFFDGQARGHKGVGLTFLVYGFDDFELESRTREGEHFVVGMEGARTWVEDQTDELEAPTAEIDHHPAKPRLTEPGVRVRMRITKTSLPKDLSKTLNTATYTATVIETQTAVGVMSPSSSPAFTASLTFVPQIGATVEVPLRTHYRYPHMVRGLKTFNLGVYLRDPSRPATPQPEHRGAYEACYWTLGPAELLARVGEPGTQLSGETITSVEELASFVREHKVKVYAMVGSSRSVATKIREDWAVPAQKGLHKPKVRVATDGMISVFEREVQLTCTTGNSDRLWLVYTFEAIEPNLGRKSFPLEVSDVIAVTESVLTTALLKEAQPFLKANRNTKPETTTTGRMNPHVKAVQRRAKPLPHAHVNGAAQGSVLSVPEEEQDVIVLFVALIASGVIPHFALVYLSGFDEFDAFLDVDPDKVSAVIAAALPGEPSIAALDCEIVAEFKLTGDVLAEDLANFTKRFADLDLLVCWEVGELLRQAGDEELQFWTADGPCDRVYAGVTHYARSSSGGSHTVPVIALKDLMAACA